MCRCMLDPNARSGGNARVRVQERQPYQWDALLKNPMVWVMGFTLVMTIVFPRLLANMGAWRRCACACSRVSSRGGVW